ncbi:phage head morphogenesis protein [Brevibacillus laterosporus]|uniref:minor capsid protein n=1 Tax=Brevibacillus laterosporus TaxID=1465 RepID=UPI000C765E54|nr:minor capsid protein [Brevibacillus laterosporus]AUM64308.1 phage head morphogenesis protein [Brevibacillus laterosporus]
MSRISQLTTKIFDYFGYTKKEVSSDRSKRDQISYRESPQTQVFDQFNVSTERIQIIRDVRKLFKTDARFKITNLRLGADATRGGCQVIVQGSESHRKHLRKLGKPQPKRLVPGANIAQQVIDDFMRRTKLSAKSTEHLQVLLRDGDIFLNPIVDLGSGLVFDVKRGPATTIKRNSDEYGDFPDIERAFSQIDPQTQIHSLMDIGPPKSSRKDFALYQMNHIRWMSEETELYGTSHYATARQLHKILLKMEIAAAIRREFRSVQKNGHKLPAGTSPSEALDYARQNQLINDKNEPTNNSHLLTDFFGTADVKAIQADANLSEMGDIEYFDDLLWLNLGVPKAILTSGQNLNRDILKVQYPQYLQSLDSMTDLLEYGDVGQYSGYRALIDLQLMLAGINPTSIAYDVVWSTKTTETALERLERVQKARGANGGDILITNVKAIQSIAGDFDIEDPVEMAMMIEEERARNAALVAKSLPIKEENADEEEDKEPITDVAAEDRSKLKKEEVEAEEAVLRFFNAVNKRFTNYESDNEGITDSVILDHAEDEILNALEETWEAEQGKLQLSLVKAMTIAGVMGAEKAASLLATEIKPRIVRSDIREDLLQQSAQRIKDMKETTLKKIQKELATGFDDNLGWRKIAKRLEPIILDEARANLIARNELSWAYDRMQIRTYKGAGVKKVQCDEVIDMRTCDKCRSRHGNVYDIDDYPGLAHPLCRVSWLPVDE